MSFKGKRKFSLKNDKYFNFMSLFTAGVALLIIGGGSFIIENFHRNQIGYQHLSKDQNQVVFQRRRCL